MDFAKNLRKIRTERGFSQQEFADKLRVAQSTVGMWESGKRTPKIVEFAHLAKILEVTVARLLEQGNIEAITNRIVINGEEIEISELDSVGLKEIIENIKAKKGKRLEVFSSQVKPHAKKVLIIDDEQQIREMLYSFLRTQNYRVFLAFNGQMGLEYFEAVEPDIVLLDIKMPDMSGMEVLKIIRKVSNVPVVILTGHPEKVAEMYPAEVEIQGYIEKPISLKVVLNTLQYLIGGGEKKAHT